MDSAAPAFHGLSVTPFNFAAPAPRPPLRPAVCCTACVGVSLLLARQLRLLCCGRTYLQAMQQQRVQWQLRHGVEQQAWQAAPAADVLEPAALCEAASLPAAAAMAAGAAEETPHNARAAGAAGAAGGVWLVLRRVFGAGHPLTWVVPAWDVPPAADSWRMKLH